MYSVYKISIGNYFYIGCSKNVRRRTTVHLSALNHNKHPNSKLSEAFKNNTNLHCDVLCEVEERKEAYKTERALIKKEKANEYCCNVLSKEEVSETHKKKLAMATSLAKKGITLSEEHKEKLRQSMLNHNTVYHCPYCAKSINNRGGMTTHIRYCKHKPQEL